MTDDTFEVALRADLARVAASTHIPPVPSPAIAPVGLERRRRRSYIAAALVGAVAVVGVPAAAAAGALPTVSNAFGWTHQSTVGIKALSGTDRQDGAVTGQGGPAMEIYTANASNHGLCWSAASVATGKVLASSCVAGIGVPKALTEVGSSSYGSGVIAQIYAPKATHLLVSDTSFSHQVAVVSGASAVWIPAYELNHVLNVSSYNAKNIKLGQISIREASAGKVPPMAPPAQRAKLVHPVTATPNPSSSSESKTGN